MDSNSSTCVAGLFTEWDVAAIIGLVIAIYIVALNGQVFSVAVGQRPILEWFKFLPFSAIRDSAASVVFIGGISRVITSSLHALPNAVKPCASHAVLQAGLAKLQVMRVLRFAVARFKTAAIGRAAFSEVISENHASFPTLATTKPESSLSSFLGTDFVRTYNSPVAKGLVS